MIEFKLNFKKCRSRGDTRSPFTFGDSGREFGVRLLVFGEMSLLAEIFTTKWTREGLLTRMRPDVNVDRVLVLETFGADAAIMQKSLTSSAGRSCHLSGL